MRATVLDIVRHAETAWNLEGRIQGQADSPLSPAGVAQAKALAARLAGGDYAALYSSDLGRARATADFIAAAIGTQMTPDARLRERHYGIFQGLTHAQARARHPEAYRLYSEEDVDFALPGGESTRQCAERSRLCLEEIAGRHPGRRVVVVTHGGVLDSLYRHVNGSPYVGSNVFALLNGSLNRFAYDGRVWRLESWADVAHLVDPRDD